MATETENTQTSTDSTILSNYTEPTDTTTPTTEVSQQPTDTTSTTTTDTTTSTLSTSTSTTGDLSYNVDYDDMSNGVRNIESAVKDVNNSINECNKVISEIFTESTFAGPFANYCYGTWNGLSELTVQTNANLDISAQVLDSNSAAYAESDKNTGEKVGSV